ncbi:MAG: dihydrodipicolinate synthase family protein [Candidatus Latescibacterota bacterium]
MADLGSALHKGIIAASPTPLMDDLSVDHDMLTEHCAWLLANGCSGIAPLGTTGEANSFSVMERSKLLEKLVISGIPAERLIAGTGCCAIPDTVQLTKHALRLGVTTVLVLPPFYYKSVGEDGLFDAFDRIIQQVADKRLKMILYHYPKVSGIPVTRGLIERLLAAYPGTVAGMKDSGGDWTFTKENCALFNDFKIYSGSETHLLDNLTAGGAGSISATLNVTCKLAAELVAKRQTDQAPVLQERLAKIRGVIERYPLVAALKHIMAIRANHRQWTRTRPPLSVLTNKDSFDLEQALTAIEFDYSAR